MAPVFWQLMKLRQHVQDRAKAKPAPQPEAKPNLRRSSRMRTEVSFSDYEAGDDITGVGPKSSLACLFVYVLPGRKAYARLKRLSHRF